MNGNQIAPVFLENYNIAWKDQYEEERKKIVELIGECIVDIQHIGSTAISGSIAKPEIDILIGVKDIKNVPMEVFDRLKKIEYYYYPHFEKFEPERRYFRKSRGIVPFVHIHMVEINSDFFKERIIFRDYLRQHPEVVQEYNNLKQSLVDKYKGDRGPYSDEKLAFVNKIIKRALMESRKPQ